MGIAREKKSQSHDPEYQDHSFHRDTQLGSFHRPRHPRGWLSTSAKPDMHASLSVRPGRTAMTILFAAHLQAGQPRSVGASLGSQEKEEKYSGVSL